MSQKEGIRNKEEVIKKKNLIAVTMSRTWVV